MKKSSKMNRITIDKTGKLGYISTMNTSDHKDTELHKIALKNGAEKTTILWPQTNQSFSYLDVYEKIFSDSFNRYDKLNILEIGTRTGGSVKTLLEYFPNSHVFGFDNLADTTCVDLSKVEFPYKIATHKNSSPQLADEDVYFTEADAERFTFIEGDQTSLEDLKKITDLCPKLDLIIDDACHLIKSFTFSYNYLIDYLSRGGVYCIEDLYNNYAYWNSDAGRTTSSNKDGEEFDHLISGLNKQIHISSCTDAPDNFTEDYGSVLSIHTYPGLLIIKKGL